MIPTNPMIFSPYAPPAETEPRTSVEKALELILTEARYELPVERVPLAEALGRVVAEELCARHSLPTVLSAQVDGIAVRFDDPPSLPDRTGDRQFAFVGTGTALPEGFDTVVRAEDLEIAADGTLRILKEPSEKGACTLPPGWELREGEILVPPDLRLEPQHLGLLAAGGHREIPVLRRPLVAVLPTGDELVPQGTVPGPGQNIDSNSVFFAGYLKDIGAEPLLYPITADDPALLTERLEDALSKADMVLINGGSSRGRRDFTAPVVAGLGKVLVHGLNSAPGKPVLLAVIGGKPVIGVPGPALAAWYALEHLIDPMVSRFLAQPPRERRSVKGLLTRELRFEGFLKEALLSLRVSLSRDADGRYLVSPYPLKNSMITNFVRSDGILRIPEGVAGYDKGDEVEILLLYPEAVIGKRMEKRQLQTLDESEVF